MPEMKVFGGGLPDQKSNRHLSLALVHLLTKSVIHRAKGTGKIVIRKHIFPQVAIG